MSQRLNTAAKLLAKAQSTDSDPEELALLERCYRTIAIVIAELDARVRDTDTTKRPLERRLRFDRRRSRIPDNARPDDSRPDDSSAALARYRYAADDGHADGGIVDRSV